jgi:hypothetical protein
MIVKRIENASRILGAPEDWKDDGSSCVGLPVRDVSTDQGMFMVSAWEPTLEEIELITKGHSIQLWIRGTSHPVVSLTVGVGLEEFKK